MFTRAVALALVALAASADSTSFAAFKEQYGKIYGSSEEEAYRAAVFDRNMLRAAEQQRANPNARFGATPYSDMTEAEFKAFHSADAKGQPKRARNEAPPLPRANTPSQVDWRTKGAVTPVVQQGGCGSCWAFSTVGNIEGQWFLAGHNLTKLSEQELVSCDFIDGGCGGGFPDDAFTWLLARKHGVIATAESYPYTSGSGDVAACKTDGLVAGAQITAYQDIARDEEVMAAHLAAKGPLSVCVDATTWQTYQGGVVTNCASSGIDHCVLAVGYDTAANPPYWIVKNSWGTGWGEEGYIRVEYGKGMCLIDKLVQTAVAGSSPAPPATPAPSLPPTPTIAPTSPPTHAPTPPPSPGATFQQKVCPTSSCGAGCNTTTLPQNQCLVDADGLGSAKVFCDGKGLLIQLQYEFTSKCEGIPFPFPVAAGVCQIDTDGSYVEYVCP